MTDVVPMRWRMAGRLDQVLPQVRGRERVINLVSGPWHRDADTVVDIGGGLRLHADLRTSAHVVRLRYAAPSLSPLFEAALRPRDVLVDVGANEGVYSCLGAQLVGPTGAVIAVEPMPSTAQRLRENISLNNIDNLVEVQQVACGADAGEVEIWMPEGGHHTTASAGRMENATPTTVPVSTLDALVGDRSPRLIKVDVEGFEAHVMDGASKVLQLSHAPIWTIELIEDNLQRAGRSSVEVIKPLKSAGYECFALDRRGLTPTSSALSHAPNIVALKPGEHGDVFSALSKVRWPQNQNC